VRGGRVARRCVHGGGRGRERGGARRGDEDIDAEGLREGERALAPVLAEPADDGLAGLGVKALKALAAERGVDISRCCEKSEIVELLRAPASAAPRPASPPSTASAVCGGESEE